MKPNTKGLAREDLLPPMTLLGCSRGPGWGWGGSPLPPQALGADNHGLAWLRSGAERLQTFKWPFLLPRFSKLQVPTEPRDSHSVGSLNPNATVDQNQPLGPALWRSGLGCCLQYRHPTWAPV